MKHDSIDLISVLKSISYDNPECFDYFTYVNDSLDSFLSERDCFYNDKKTSTEIVINDLRKKFLAVANYVKEAGISCDYITFNINYGVVCDKKYALYYKELIEHATKTYREFCSNLEPDDFSWPRAALVDRIISSYKKAVEIYNEELDDYLFSNLISFRILSVDLNHYLMKFDKKSRTIDIGQPEIVARENSDELGDRQGLYLANFKEFTTKMRDYGFDIETGDSRPMYTYEDYLDGFKTGEYFKVSGDLKKILKLNNKNNQ